MCGLAFISQLARVLFDIVVNFAGLESAPVKDAV